MPRDHFWNKRSSKKESTLDGSKTNGLTAGNGDVTRESGSPRGSQKAPKTSSSGTGLKHLFGWGPVRKKSVDGSKVPRSVSSSALSETRTIGFKRTASNGEVEPNRTSVDYLAPIDRRMDQRHVERQRHSSDRALQTKNSPQIIYSLPADTICRKVNGDPTSIATNVMKSPSPVNSRPAKTHDYTEPWSFTIDGTSGTKSRSTSVPTIHHGKGGSSKKKDNVSSASENSVSPPSISPEAVNNDVNSDDYEEPWDKYTGGIPVFRKRSKAGRISPKALPKPPAELPKPPAELPKPPAELPKPPTEIMKPLPPPPSLSDNEDNVDKELTVPTALPKRSVSLKASSASDYSIPVDTKRTSDTVSPTFKQVDRCSSHGGSSSEELRSPTPPPPLPVRYVTTPIVNASLPLEQQP